MRKILIVDDDIEILQLISDLLTERKLKVITTTKGLEVEELAIKKEPDLIILDINLPDIRRHRGVKKFEEATHNIFYSCNYAYRENLSRFSG